MGLTLTRDPIGYGDGLNVYLYVRNNPINFVDPLGLRLVPKGSPAFKRAVASKSIDNSVLLFQHS